MKCQTNALSLAFSVFDSASSFFEIHQISLRGDTSGFSSSDHQLLQDLVTFIADYTCHSYWGVEMFLTLEIDLEGDLEVLPDATSF